jgi:predicted  nucleic acid-binding Zn-ribbon protein
MTSDEQKKIRNFEARVRQLILQYRNLEDEIARLQGELGKKDEEIARLTSELKSVDENYQHLKIAKFVEISDGDLKSAKQRMTRLVREINRCIGLLNAEEVAVEEQSGDTAL